MDIHDSDIKKLLARVAKKNYQKYLREIRLKSVRAFKDQKISFDFPVTAIIGTNGGGKSTILGAAALAYRNTKPGDYFPKSNVGDNSMANWRIEYEILDRTIVEKQITNRNARFVSAKWRRDDLADREVIAFPIQRTVPASEQARYKKFIGIYQVEDTNIETLPLSVRRAIGRILGKDLSGYKIARLKADDKDYLFLGYQKSSDYSQFHFGAGEASIIEMVTKIDAAGPEALILIEEIENGLHPLATEKMVEYLIDVAEKKRLQIVFTTHSEYALKVLPPEGVWACIDGEAYQGKLSIESLRAMTGQTEKDRVIFIEDEFAKDWIEDMIRQKDPNLLRSSDVHAAGGYPHILDVLKHHNSNPTIKAKAIAVVDGDVTLDKELANVFRLPGDIPELELFEYVASISNSKSSLIQQRCQCPNVSQDNIISAINRVRVDTTDFHLIFKKLGEELGFLSEIIVRRGFLSIYNEDKRNALAELVQKITE